MFNWINSFPFAVCFHSIPNTMIPTCKDHLKKANASERKQYNTQVIAL